MPLNVTPLTVVGEDLSTDLIDFCATRATHTGDDTFPLIAQDDSIGSFPLEIESEIIDRVFISQLLICITRKQRKAAVETVRRAGSISSSCIANYHPIYLVWN